MAMLMPLQSSFHWVTLGAMIMGTWVVRVFDQAFKALLLTGLEVALIQNYMNRCSLNGINS
jgi:hypothetical protein